MDLQKGTRAPASASNYERYVLCSLGVQRLLRYPGLTPEASVTRLSVVRDLLLAAHLHTAHCLSSFL